MKYGIIFLLLILQAGAQQLDTEYFKADCSKSNNAASCRSFNELVESQDKHIMQILRERDAFACFQEDEDRFFVISYFRPRSMLQKKSNASSERAGNVSYEEYQDGVLKMSAIAFGTWVKPAFVNTISFVTPDSSTRSASIDDDEVAFSHFFANIGNTSTFHSINIRFSTLRFSETFQWKKSPTKASKNEQMRNSGHCTDYLQEEDQ